MSGWAGAVLVLIFGAAAESCPMWTGKTVTSVTTPCLVGATATPSRYDRAAASKSVTGDGLTTTRLDCELGAAELLPGISKPRGAALVARARHEPPAGFVVGNPLYLNLIQWTAKNI